jgi:hypothetical protein
MSMETIEYIEEEPTQNPEGLYERELSEEAIDERFAAIVKAEENIAAGDPVEREHRNRAVSYKPNQGFDMSNMQPPHAA